MPYHEPERIAVLEQQVKTLEEVVADIQKRLRDVEHTVWKAVGAMTVLQVIIGVVIKKFL